MMLVLVLRGLTGTAMAAGLVPPAKPCAPLTVLGAVHGEDDFHQAAGHGHAHAPADDGVSYAAGHAQGHGGQTAKSPCHEAATASGAHTGTEHTACGQVQGDSNCSVCDICHSAMLALPVVLAGVPARMGVSLPDASARFHSALAALALEPPIG